MEKYCEHVLTVSLVFDPEEEKFFRKYYESMQAKGFYDSFDSFLGHLLVFGCIDDLKRKVETYC